MSEIRAHWLSIWTNAAWCVLAQAATAPLFGLPWLSWRIGAGLAVGGWLGHTSFVLRRRFARGAA